MKYKITDLDKRCCDIEPEATNTQTLREFINESEKHLNLGISTDKDFNTMTSEELIDMVEELDYLWGK